MARPPGAVALPARRPAAWAPRGGFTFSQSSGKSCDGDRQVSDVTRVSAALKCPAAMRKSSRYCRLKPMAMGSPLYSFSMVSRTITGKRQSFLTVIFNGDIFSGAIISGASPRARTERSAVPALKVAHETHQRLDGFQFHRIVK